SLDTARSRLLPSARCPFFSLSSFAPVTLSVSLLFFFSCAGDPRDLHSFPTRRSSDLGAARGAGGRGPAQRGGQGDRVGAAGEIPATAGDRTVPVRQGFLRGGAEGLDGGDPGGDRGVGPVVARC